MSFNKPRSFEEKVRNLGSFLAHETFDGISELAAFIPQLNEEIKEIGTKIIPESILGSHSELLTDPIENYEKLIAAGHEKIDEVFSTNLKEYYTSEASTDNLGHDFAIGILPLPEGGFFGKKGWELKNPKYQPSKNVVTDINGHLYRGHALDQMQNRGIPPSVVENTIEKGEIVNVDKNLGTIEFYDPINKIKVVTNEREEIVTVIRVDQVK